MESEERMLEKAAKARAERLGPQPCKNNCGNHRRLTSAYCQACSDKYKKIVNPLPPNEKRG